jgi:FAD/FMN-containing dehydrogenase
MMEEGQERMQATYRQNYERLVAIKRKYDPNDFFRVNQNIQPLAVASSSLVVPAILSMT